MPPPDSPVMIRISMLVPFSADDPHLRLQMHAVAQYLFHNEKLDGEQFAALMEGKPVPGAPQTEMPAMPEVADVPPVDGELPH